MQEIGMQVVNKLTMFQMAVTNVPKAKDRYAGKLGLKVAKDYRQDDDHWWGMLIDTTKHLGRALPRDRSVDRESRG